MIFYGFYLYILVDCGLFAYILYINNVPSKNMYPSYIVQDLLPFYLKYLSYLDVVCKRGRLN